MRLGLQMNLHKPKHTYECVAKIVKAEQGEMYYNKIMLPPTGNYRLTFTFVHPKY